MDHNNVNIIKEYRGDGNYTVFSLFIFFFIFFSLLIFIYFTFYFLNTKNILYWGIAN